MRKSALPPAAALLLVMVLLASTAGCDLLAANGGAPTTAPRTEASVPTPSPTPDPTAPPTPTPTPEPTPPPGVLGQDVYTRFETVGFGGQRDGAPAIARWTGQISIEVAGKPNEDDRKALAAIIGKLRGIPGVPEILLVTARGNFVIGFLPESSGNTIVPGYGGGAQGFAELASGAQRAGVLIPDELADQAARDGSLAHWMLLGMGLAAGLEDSQPGSALDSGFAATAPSDGDWLMLSLLYGSGVKPGMTAADAMPAVYAYDPANAIPPDSANSPAIGRQARLAYFNELGFYYGGSSTGVVSKWAAPVKLQVAGEPTAGQRELLDAYLTRISAVPGFPGFEEGASGGTLLLSFQPVAELKREYPTMTAGESGYFSVTRAKGGKIAKCVIGMATDFPDEASARTQFLRMLLRALGFEHTSAAYPDSAFNYAAAAQDWAALDWAMVEFLYRPDVKPGEKRAAVMKKLEQ